MTEREPLMKIAHVKKYFNVGGGRILKAVDDVSLNIYNGETLALVGESGCGKSTLGRTVMGAYEPTEGSVVFNGVEMCGASKKQRREFSKNAQMIFQDPYSALNPRMTVADIIGEGLAIHRLLKGEALQERIRGLLTMVGLSSGAGSRFPHEFSGGQRQRIVIARALSLNPRFIVCDEPISALDVSIQAQIVNLMRSLQKKLSLTNLFIAHDLNMVRFISDRTAVMYLGRIMELGESTAVNDRPLHPYTQALISSVPLADPKLEKLRKPLLLEGEIPSPIYPPQGCAFCTRCPKAMERCKKERPVLSEVEKGRQVACFLY